ncbi:patatin-like phospholipase family protein [Legionella israelensis]|uniref:Patatin-like phospholipase family protein n=1 Tax=Legionella israelensis TaxID=454 RepID=A0AAX1EIP3_9GAMM|nr:patatin-like phospholipase family protein [Legionella israelensis]QBR85010.1 patatin-like phospholipase family protein [Legionella israelensis]
MARTSKKINLALQGGGAHGALAWGIIDKLLEDGRVSFDSISATSAGAMNAAVLAYGLARGGNDAAREALHSFWKMISDAGELYSPIRSTPIESFFNVKMEHSMSYFLFDLLTKIFSPYQLNPFNFNPLREVLEKNVDFNEIASCKHTKIFISATNVKTGKIKVFDNKEISIDAVMASACLPFMFQAVKVEEDYYWDGGYMGNPAIFPLIYNSDCNDVLILHINPIYRDEVPETAADILNRVNEISFNSSLMREMRAINFVSRLIDENWIKDEYKSQLKRMFIHAIRADMTMQSYSVASKLNPEWAFIRELYETGRAKGEEWLKDNLNKIGKVSSIDITEYM